MLKSFLLSLVLLSSADSMSSEFRIQKVRTLGSMKNKVIFQSRVLKKIKQSKVLKGKLVAQWGTQVFEVVQGFYTCDRNQFCKLSDYERIATFESCSVKGLKKIECKNRLDGGLSSVSVANEIVVLDDPDSTSDELNRRGHYDPEAEFPARVNDDEFPSF